MNRAKRRFKTEVKRQRREKMWKDSDWDMNDKHKRMLRDTHFGCGCSMCKPWKHGFESRYKPSERRKLDDVSTS